MPNDARKAPSKRCLAQFKPAVTTQALKLSTACMGLGNCEESATGCIEAGCTYLSYDSVGSTCEACGSCCFQNHAKHLEAKAGHRKRPKHTKHRDSPSPQRQAPPEMQMAKESVQKREKQEATMPAGRTTRLPALRLTALEQEAAKAFFAQDQYLDNLDLRSPPPPPPPPTSARAGGSYDDIRPSLPEKRMRLWVPSPPTSPSSENYIPALALPARTAIAILCKGLPAPAVNHGISNRSWADRPPPPPAIQLPPLPSPQEASAEASAKDNSGLSQYEKDRLARIESNKELMRALGIFQPTSATESAANSAAKPRRPYNKIPKGRPAQRHKSERTTGKVVNYKDPHENDVDISRSPSPGHAETEHAGSPVPETHGKEQRCSSPELPSLLCKRLRDKSSK